MSYAIRRARADLFDILTLAAAALALCATQVQAREDEEATHLNHAAIFAGATSFGGEPTRPSLGAEYEHRMPLLQRRIGLGALVEDSWSDQSETLVAVPVTYHVHKEVLGNRGAKVFVAPGVKFPHGSSGFVFRAGLGYDIELNHHYSHALVLTPLLNADFSNDPIALVYGLAFGCEF